MRKTLLLLIKFIPVMQMAGMLLNNTLCYFNLNFDIIYLLDYLIGNSLITTVLLLICSHIFKYCAWHRIIIFANFVNISIANVDAIFGIDITDLHLLCVYYIISIISILVATINHVNYGERSKT